MDDFTTDSKEPNPLSGLVFPLLTRVRPTPVVSLLVVTLTLASTGSPRLNAVFFVDEVVDSF